MDKFQWPTYGKLFPESFVHHQKSTPLMLVTNGYVEDPDVHTVFHQLSDRFDNMLSSVW
jgi:hypothetical protein